MNTETNSKAAEPGLADVKTAPFLVGERVTLRTVSRADVPLLFRWINDSETNRFLIRGDFPMGWDDEVEGVDKISRRKEGELYLGIEVADLGLIGLITMKVESWINRTAVTGTMIGNPEARGKGYGTEAKMLLLAHAFRRLNLRKVYSNVYAPNERSLNCQKRCGYVEEGRFKEDVFLNGRYHDVITLAAWRDTFEAAEKEWLEKKAARLA